MLLEEFGYARSNPDHIVAYRKWLDTINQNPDCAGWLVWRLVSLQDNLLYPVRASIGCRGLSPIRSCSEGRQSHHR